MNRRLPRTRQEVCEWVSMNPDEHQFESVEEVIEAALRLATLFMLAAEEEDPLYHVKAGSDDTDLDYARNVGYARWPFAESLMLSLSAAADAFEYAKREALLADKVVRA